MEIAWRKSSRSYGNGACVEVGPTKGHILVRDSKQEASGTWLEFSTAEWSIFADAIKSGLVGHPVNSNS